MVRLDLRSSHYALTDGNVSIGFSRKGSPCRKCKSCARDLERERRARRRAGASGS